MRFLSLILLLFLAVPVSAQEVPRWAAPSDPQGSTDDWGGTFDECGRQADCDDTPPDNPIDPAPAPLGGAEWVMLAGAAYALRRLRSTDSE